MTLRSEWIPRPEKPATSNNRGGLLLLQHQLLLRRLVWASAAMIWSSRFQPLIDPVL